MKKPKHITKLSKLRQAREISLGEEVFKVGKSVFEVEEIARSLSSPDTYFETRHKIRFNNTFLIGQYETHSAAVAAIVLYMNRNT